jgi:alpha-glucoside transport system substrate-binding protein
MSVRPSRRTAAVVGGIAAALLLAACGSSSDGGGSSASATNTDPACADYAAYGSHPNTTVTVFTSILPPEQQKFEEAWAQFEKCTGIKVKYEGSDQFEAQLPTRIAGGNAPDIAFIPQPGLLSKLVSQGGPVAAPEGVAANMDKWNAQWKTYGTVDGTFYAAPLGSNMKSLVWYSPAVFKAKGYTVPTTWDDMISLSNKMAADGMKPWCGGIESGGATGWPATDWLEQVVLRQQGGDVYDQWIAHTVLFNSPQITDSMNVVAGWMKNPKFVNAGFGDVKTIATTAFQDAGKPILTGKCGMLQQASFYAAQWPSFKKDAKIAEDGDVFAFYLPQMSDKVPTPIVGGGEFVTAFSDKPEVQQFQTYLSSSLFATNKVKLGGWVSANSGVDLSLYQDPISALSAKYLTDANATFRFDASDLMPAAVGAGAEWKQLTAWFATDQSTETTLQNIDAAWPTS